MYIGQVREATDEILRALERLIPQLGAHKRPPARGELAALLNSEGCRFLVARHPDERGEIVAALCLTVYRVPTGIRSIVEDVVVDESHRRQGIGEALMRKAIGLAREAGAEGISLTSNPQREAANHLYRSLGFELRKTNSYILRLK